MRRIFLAVALAATLAGCATIRNLETALQLGTASIANPVTPTRLDQMEAAVTLVFTGLNAWKVSCAQGLINASCKGQIAAVQVYTRKLPPFLKQLRGFVKANDQVNATVLFNQVIDLIGAVKAEAASAGHNLGS